MKRVQYMAKSVLLGLLLLSTLGLQACKEKQAPKSKQRIVVAEKRSVSTHLYYNGTIAPIKTDSAVSPVNGRVATMHFEYGAPIKKGQLLVTIDSADLSDKFRSAISDYLTTKENLSTQHITYQGMQALYKAGIETKNSFITARSQYETAEMNYYQKKIALEKILRQANLKMKEFENLTISDTKSVNAALSHKFSSLPIAATGSGVALFPVKSDSGGDDSNGNKLIVGSEVKQGQLIVSIGDLSGLSVSFKVGEVDINRIKPGLPVVVSGVSFPGIELQGHIAQVASQASEGSGNQALSQFDVTVKIPKLSKQQRKVVHIGMTSKVDIDIKNPPQVMLPIAAVTQVDGRSVVTVMGKDGKTSQVPVITGSTNMSDVAIISGVSAGQKVVINDTV